MMTEVFANADELQIILNLLDASLTVSFPFYDFHLFKATQKENSVDIDLTCYDRDFTLCRSQFQTHYEEMPGYDDLIDVMLYAGIIDYVNHDELDLLLTNISHWPSSKKACFCPDTNLFYQLFFTNHPRMKPQDVVLIETVGDEIHHAKSHTLNSTKNREIKQLITRQKKWYPEKDGTRTKQARRAEYLAHTEYERVKHRALQLKNGIRPTEKDNDKNDQIIVDTAHAIRSERYPDLYLLTADKGVANRCEELDISHLLLVIPHMIESARCSYQQFRTLLYTLARVFRVIKINSVFIYGDIHQNTIDGLEHVLLRFQHDPLESDCLKHLELCRQINQIGIPDGE